LPASASDFSVVFAVLLARSVHFSLLDGLDCHFGCRRKFLQRLAFGKNGGSLTGHIAMFWRTGGKQSHVEIELLWQAGKRLARKEPQEIGRLQ
jgi:hypothetical protein